jgi:hypothetical protein
MDVEITALLFICIVIASVGLRFLYVKYRDRRTGLESYVSHGGSYGGSGDMFESTMVPESRLF